MTTPTGSPPPPAGPHTEPPAPARVDAFDRDITAVRVHPDVVVSILHELREQRATLEEMAKGNLLAYVKEIGRSTLPGGIRVDVAIVLGLAAALGLLGNAGDVGARLVTALIGVSP